MQAAVHHSMKKAQVSGRGPPGDESKGKTKLTKLILKKGKKVAKIKKSVVF